MRSHSRYTAVAVALHWIIATAIVVNLGLGLWMGRAIDSMADPAGAIDAFQWHKSIGLTVLVLSLARLAWRFLYPPPPLPAHMLPWERTAAAITHWLFYILMVAIPLSGWLYVSAQWRGDAPFTIPTLWFGLFEVPHLFGLNEAGMELRRRLASLAIDSHGALALALVGLLILHIAAALRHQFWQRDGLLARMLPWLSSPERLTPPPRSPGGGLSGILAATATLVIAVVFIGYGTTATLVPGETSLKPAAAEALQDLIDTDTPAWSVDADNSHIRFAGVHAGRDFQGHFGQWRAAIHFDPQNPGQSQIAAVVDTASATDGVPLHDRTLPQGEWFDSANHPYATYRSTAITRLGEDNYQLEGTLTIKDNPVELPPLTMTLAEDTLRIEGEVALDRAEVDMGMESDPGGQFVSRTITIDVDVAANAP